jgi:U4/U6.U5 tri-snRNP-associated protein 2
VDNHGITAFVTQRKMKRSLASSNDDHPRSSKQARKNLSPSSSSSSSTTTTTSALTPNCPFLDTVRRNVLDFDVPHICKTTLSNQNVYACLVCGQFYRGRGAKSPAFIHALNESHFVFMKLDTGAAYCLPAGYEIHDSSLNDIKHELKPSFTRTMLTNMKTAHHIKKDTRGDDYLPGFIGLTNFKKTDSVNAIIQLLARVVPFQHFFLSQDNHLLENCKSLLVQNFADVLRRIWNPNSFKRFVGPYQFIHALSTTSRGQFSVGKRAHCIQWLQWMLNHM